MTRRAMIGIMACGALLHAAPARTEAAEEARSQARSGAVVVYLPALPIESATRLASAITELGDYLNRATGLTLEVKAFRRAEDVTGFLEQSGDQVALLVADAALLHELPPNLRVAPVFRFTRGGRESSRKIIVARDPAIKSLRDLRGKRLAVAYGPGRSMLSFVTRAVFGGEIAPESWFGEMLHESDDLSAAASVLFGRADAALVSEGNPFVASHLGKDLREVFASGPVSLPIVALREGALDEAQQSAVRRALADLGAHTDGQKLLAGLGLDGLRAVAEGEGAALLRLAAAPQRALEIAMPSLAGLGVNLLPPLKADQLPYVVALPIVEAPLPTLMSGTGSKPGSGSQ